MRIASGVVDQYVYFVAVDATDFTTRETGLTTFTVYRSRDGAAAAAMTTPTVNETDSTNMPGVYELLLDEDMTIGVGNDTEAMVFHITATGMAPVTREIELYRPKITEGNTLTVSDGGAANTDGSGASGAVNFVNDSDNVSTALQGVSFVGVETSGTNESVNGLDGVQHVIDDAANLFDIVYRFPVGGGRQAANVIFSGDLSSANDQCAVQAYNGSTWDTVFTLDGSAGAIERTIPLFNTHTGTGADLGNVYIRFVTLSAQTNPTLSIDQLLVSAVNIGTSVGYAGGMIYVDTINGTAGTESFVNGVADNPVDSLADALTLATALNLPSLKFATGSSVTLVSTAANYRLEGDAWTLALGGQSIAGAFIKGATLSGTFTGTTAIIENCIINAITGPGLTMRSCYLNEVTVTNNGANGWYMNDCRSRVAGTGSPNFDFGAAAGSTGLSVRAYSGGLEIENMGQAGTDTMSLEGDGAITFNANCVGGSLAIRGNFKITDNASGAVVLTPTVPTIGQVDQGAAQGGTINTITLAATASATNGQYDPGTVTVVTGAGAGQSRSIIDYNGTTKVAVIDKDWRTTPDTTSSYIVTSASSALHVNEGMAQGGAASTITLNTAGSSTTDIYVGQTVFIVGGTGQDQSRIVTAYNGTTKVATVHRAWDVTPDATSSYVMLPLPTIGDVVVDIDTKTDDIQGATFDTATDSLEAIRDRGDAAWVTGGGGSAPTVGEIADAVWDEAQAGHVTAGTFGEIATEIADIQTQIGTAGAGLSNIPWNASWDVEVESEVTDALTAFGASTLTTAQVNSEMVDVVNVDVYAEPGTGAPPAAPTFRQMTHYLYKNWRNRKTQDATTWELYNDNATTVGQQAAVSDDGTDAEKGEIASG